MPFKKTKCDKEKFVSEIKSAVDLRGKIDEFSLIEKIKLKLKNFNKFLKIFGKPKISSRYLKHNKNSS